MVISALVSVNAARSQSAKPTDEYSVTAYCTPWAAHYPYTANTALAITTAKQLEYVYRFKIDLASDFGTSVTRTLLHRSDPPDKLCWTRNVDVRLVIIVHHRRKVDTLSFSPGFECMQLNDRFIYTDGDLLRAIAYQLPYWHAIMILNDPYVRNH